MTLDTRIYVHDEIDRTEVFAKCQELLGSLPHITAHKPGTMANECGQGLPAWLMLHYGIDGPLRPTITYCDCEDEYACDTRCSKGPTYLEIMFDTGYGYSDALGRNCGALHACYIAKLGEWLDARGIAWSWKNEYSGEIHGGDDRYARLTDLMRDGDAGCEWFANIFPALIEGIERGEL